MSTRLTAARRTRTVTLDANDGAALAWLHQNGEVVSQTEDGSTFTIDVPVVGH